MNKDEIRSWAYSKGYNAYGNQKKQHVPLNLKQIIFSPVSNKLVELKIDIKFENFSKLMKLAENAHKLGTLQRTKNDKFKAHLTVNGTTQKIKLRLKGDQLDHLRDKKWSLRIETKKPVFGMRKFNLQHPQTRGFLGPIAIDSFRRELDIIAPRSTFVRLVVNGESYGVMQLEEHFSKELLEYSRRKESLILKFDDQFRWKFGNIYNYRNSPLIPFSQSKIDQNPYLLGMYNHISEKYQNFLEGKIKVSEIFDCKSFGKKIALDQIFGTVHGLRFDNMRFYLNPYTLKLEPIGYDDGFNERLVFGNSIFKNDLVFLNKLFSDNDMVQCLESAYNSLINKEIPKLKTEVHQMNIDNYWEQIITEYFLLDKLPISSSLNLNSNSNFNELFSKFNHVSELQKEIPELDVGSMNYLKNFFHIDPKKNEFKIKNGSFNIYKKLILPKGYSLKMPKNTTTIWRMHNGAGIHVEGETEIYGKLNIEGVDKNSGWIFINANGLEVTLNNILMKRCSNPNQFPLFLTGAISIYNSKKLSMDNIKIIDNNSEDAINIIRSNFLVKNTYIGNTKSDAIDVDFGTGSFDNLQLENIGLAGGGDGIDISGSKVDANKITFKNVSDKAFSIGEKSFIEINSSFIEDTLVGIASKDGSKVFVETVNFKNTKLYDLMAYRKKPEYEESFIKIETQNTISSIAGEYGNININGAFIQKQILDIDQLYDTSMKSKK